jgi:hypothetical protein
MERLDRTLKVYLGINSTKKEKSFKQEAALNSASTA